MIGVLVAEVFLLLLFVPFISGSLTFFDVWMLLDLSRLLPIASPLIRAVSSILEFGRDVLVLNGRVVIVVASMMLWDNCSLGTDGRFIGCTAVDSPCDMLISNTINTQRTND